MALEKTGLTAVLEGLPAFKSAVDDMNKRIASVTKQTEGATKATDPFNKALDKAGVSVNGLRDKLKGFIKDSVPFGDQLGGIVDKLVAIPLPALAAVAAITALVTAFIELGNRGAPLQEIGIAFDHLTASVGLTSQALLKDLRSASEGTIADFDLIKTASTALLGVTGDFGKQFGQALPQFLKIAKAEADATGRSVNELFNNIVEGVKKGTPKLIESTGLIIDQKAAYQDYAKSLGITVAQLSDADKSQALLNATLAAGQIAIDSLSGSLESNADKLDRQQATITNTIDAFAIAVQPAFGVVLDSTQKVLDIFQQLGQAVAPIFGGIVSIIADVFSTVVNIVTSIAQPFVDAFSSIAPYVALVFQTVANIISGVGKIIGDVVGGIVKFLSDVGKQFFGLDLKNLGPQLFNGAAAAFGSFANGIIAVANKLIFPAVIGIAQFIADFLIGFSPPKEGPLSQIDKGGQNLMEAWLGGISGVSLDPVKKVAAEVATALGAIGTESLAQVNKRLAQLDKSIQPFQNRLDIIKAQFDALNEPAKQALDAIDRQTAQLQDAVAQGDPQAAARLKLLDQQRDAIQGQVDAQQALVDRAQIQLALAKAQQAPERALLSIRQAALQAVAKAAPGAIKSGGGAGAGTTPKTSGKGAGEVATPGAGGAVPSVGAAGLPSVLDLIGGQDAVDKAAQGLSDAFTGAIDQSGLQDFAQNELDLGSQIDRIKSVDIGAKITDKFKGLTDVFNPEIDGSPANVIRNFFNGDATSPGSIAFYFAHVGDNLDAIKSSVGDGLSNILSGIFDPNVDGSPMNVVLTLVGQVTGDANVPGEVATLFSNLPANTSAAASGLFDSLKTSVFDPVINFLTGTGTGTMGDVLNQFVTLFGTMPAYLVDALKNLGGMVYNAVVVPIINVLNVGISAIEGLVRSVASGIGKILGDIIAGFDNAQVAGTNLGGLVPQGLRDFQASLSSTGQNFSIGRISTALPSFLAPPGGATGGLFSSGLMKVGERGSELMFNASKVGVIPHDLTQALTSLSAILAQPQPMPVGGNTYNQSSSNMNLTFNGVQGASDVIRRMSLLRAGG